jgi:hypothetical protein
VRRRTATVVGVLSCLMLGTVALCGFGAAPTTPASVAEFHGTRIPAGPARRSVVNGLMQPWESSNWSGYAISGTFTSVVGNWNVPTVVPPTTKKKTNRFSSTWVGIDGYNDSYLIQAGTEQDWVRHKSFYQAWWEILPAAEKPIPSLTIHPGDAMSVSITEGASSHWTISVSDTTTNQSFSVVRTFYGPRSSAEWIQEAPTIGRKVAKLADDTNVLFDLSRANTLSPAFNADERGIMIQGGVAISTPSTPNPNADGFAVAYGRFAPPAPSS